MSFFHPRRRSAEVRLDCNRLEERRQALAEASEKWRSLLRDMEGRGESGQPRYETYFQAYLRAREQEKHADLELFNLRAGLTG